MNTDAGTVTVIDVQALSAVATITTGGKLASGVADGQGNLFVNQVDTGVLLRIDTTRNTVTARWKLAGCEHPHGLAVDDYNRRVFVGCDNGKMLVVDGGNGRVVAQAPIGQGSGDLAYDKDRHLVFSANGDGTLSSLDAVSLTAMGPLTTAPGARSMALDPVSGRIFLVTADTGAGTPLTFKPGSVKLLVLAPAS
jgi:DNA-binding beta-propeller fold protein YncE